MDATDVPVESVREVGPETIALELSTPEGFDASPGQFVLLRAVVDGEEISRHYTLSSPDVGATFEITVGIDPDGDLSPHLADLEPGETVRIEGPFGRITYEGDEDVVAIAGGPGVGPAVAIAEAAREAGHDATVVYRADEPAHRDRLDALADAGADVILLSADDGSADDGSADDESVSAGDDASGGDADALAEAVGAHLADGRIYAFGFEAFVTAVADAIADAGGDPDEALIENFG